MLLMEAKLQRRIQRYGWDAASTDYETLWQTRLACAQNEVLARVAPAEGERALDVACGTGLVALAAATKVGPHGEVVGVDLSGRMIEAARCQARYRNLIQTRFQRMDAEALELPDASFDVALCAFGLMYVPEPARALAEMRRVLRPGGRLGLVVWGERAACGWSPVFGIVEDEINTEACPLFFQLGSHDYLAQLCSQAKFERIRTLRMSAVLDYATADEACQAVFVGGPLALAWSRFDTAARERVCERYLQAIDQWRGPGRYRVPAEFVIVTASVPAT